MLNITKPVHLKDLFLTIQQAQFYIYCSHIVIWENLKTVTIQKIYGGKKVLLPTFSWVKYLQLKREVCNG